MSSSKFSLFGTIGTVYNAVGVSFNSLAKVAEVVGDKAPNIVKNVLEATDDITRIGAVSAKGALEDAKHTATLDSIRNISEFNAAVADLDITAEEAAKAKATYGL